MEPLGGPSETTSDVSVSTFVPVARVSLVSCEEKLSSACCEEELHVFQLPSLVSFLLRPLQYSVFVGGGDLPPLEIEQRDEEVPSCSAVKTTSQMISSQRISTYLPGFLQRFGSYATSPVVKQGRYLFFVCSLLCSSFFSFLFFYYSPFFSFVIIAECAVRVISCVVCLTILLVSPDVEGTCGQISSSHPHPLAPDVVPEPERFAFVSTDDKAADRSALSCSAQQTDELRSSLSCRVGRVRSFL